MSKPINPQQQEFRIGLLVVSGFLAVVLLILLSDKISFDSYYRVTAYMDSASGLRSSSPVELSGIQIGEIDTIQTARSGTAAGAVIAVLRIDDRYTLYKSSVLTIGSSGIFGDSFLTFTTAMDGDTSELSKDGNAVIVAKPGFIDAVRTKGNLIIDDILDVLNDDTRADIKRLVHEGADTAAQAHILVQTLNASSAHITASLANLDAASLAIKTQADLLGQQSSSVLSNLDSGINEMRKSVSGIGGKLDAIAQNLDDSLQSINTLSSAGSDLIQAGKADFITALQHLAQLSGDMQVLSSELRAGKGVAGKLLRSEALAKDLDAVAINVQNLSERISDHPEILIFGDSEADQAKARLQRQRRQQRRAFNEGYGSVLGTRRPGGETRDTSTDTTADTITATSTDTSTVSSANSLAPVDVLEADEATDASPTSPTSETRKTNTSGK